MKAYLVAYLNTHQVPATVAKIGIRSESARTLTVTPEDSHLFAVDITHRDGTDFSTAKDVLITFLRSPIGRVRYGWVLKYPLL